MRNRTVASAAAMLFLAVPALGQSADTFVGGHGATVPATYRGTHDGVDWHLDLWPDQGAHLLRTPAQGGADAAAAGRWYADGEAGALRLDLGGESVTLHVRNAERLRPAGAPEDTSGDLVTDGTLDPATITLPVAGMFTYLADAPTIVHCATGRLHPVAQDGDYLALESAYLDDRPGPGEPLFVTVAATIVQRAQMEGADRLTVVPDQFGATWPGETCARAAAAPTLAGTVWRIRSLAGEDLDWSPPGREPALVLRAGEGRFTATVGCNTLLGGFTVTGDDLAFGPAASTMMACPDPQAGWEARLGKVLAATASHAIGGRTLRLFDGGGGVIARGEAVYLP